MDKQENRRLIHSLDKTIEQKTQENLELLYTDPLTQTYKKVKFEKDRKIHKDAFITLFNIKNFSKINEAYGFKVGDELLRQLAKLLNMKHLHDSCAMGRSTLLIILSLLPKIVDFYMRLQKS